MLTAIPIIIEGQETAYNGFLYQFTTGKPLQNVQLTINYYGNGSTKGTNASILYEALIIVKIRLPKFLFTAF
jgi:hypothetical protein